MKKQNSKPTKAEKNKNLKNLNTSRSTNTKKSREEVLAEMRTVLEKTNNSAAKAKKTKTTKVAEPKKEVTKTAKTTTSKSTKTTNSTKTATKNVVDNSSKTPKKETKPKTKKENTNTNSTAKTKTKTNKTTGAVKKINQKEEVKKQEKATKTKAKKQAKTAGNTSYEKAKNNNPLIFEKLKNGDYTKKQILAVTIPSITLLILLFFFSTIFALTNIGSDKIIKGVTIFDIDVSDMTRDEAKQKIDDEINKRLNTDIVFKHNDKSFALLPTTIKAEFNEEEILDEAYSLGRYNNIFANNFEILRTKIAKKNILPSLTYEYTMIEEGAPEIVSMIEDGLREPTYGVEGTTLTITSGKDGYIVDSDELNKLISDKLCAPEYNNEVIELPLKYSEAQKIDIDKIYNDVHKEYVNASFTKEPYSFIPAQTGLDFDISIDEAKQKIQTVQDTYEIPLKILYPEITNNDIGLDAFPDELAEYDTNYSSSNWNRSHNIEKAAEKINGLVMMPGDEFSFNGVVGQRTAATGFAIAGVYVNGQVSNDYGGGICQVSSTLYNAVLRANLEVTERHNHQFKVAYCPIGTDATVSWGWPDFKFKNNRNYPIKLVLYTENKNVFVSIYGLHQDDDCEVSIISSQTGTVPYTTTYTTDSSLGAGNERVVQSGSNGATSVTTKILYKDGVEIYREQISYDYYSAHNQVVARGN